MFTNAAVLELIADDLVAEKDSFDRGSGYDRGAEMAGRLVDSLGVDEETAAGLVNFSRVQCLYGRVGQSPAAMLAKAVADQPAALENLRARRRKFADYKPTPRQEPEPYAEPASQDGWQTMADLRGQIAALRGHESRSEFTASDYSPWELAQLDHERHADLVEVAGHEARHCVVGLACGASVREIRVSADRGSCHFDNIPPEYDAEVTLSGSLWTERSVWGDRAASDMKFLDRAIFLSNPAATPGSDAWHARYELAECRVNDILAGQHEVYRALKAHLIRHGHASREEVAQLWNTYGR